jgi:hypothetical protein
MRFLHAESSLALRSESLHPSVRARLDWRMRHTGWAAYELCQELIMADYRNALGLPRHHSSPRH